MNHSRQLHIDSFKGIDTGVGGNPVFIVFDDGTEKDLPPRNDLANHSPDGFSWGYGGSGPAQLSLAILAYLYDDEKAMRHYQEFKADIISQLPQEQDWDMSADQVYAWMRIHEDNEN